jgi:hypothetical protein
LSKPYLKKAHHKKRADGVLQGVGPEIKPQYKEEERREKCMDGYTQNGKWEIKLLLLSHFL